VLIVALLFDQRTIFSTETGIEEVATMTDAEPEESKFCSCGKIGRPE